MKQLLQRRVTLEGQLLQRWALLSARKGREARSDSVHFGHSKQVMVWGLDLQIFAPPNYYLNLMLKTQDGIQVGNGQCSYWAIAA